MTHHPAYFRASQAMARAGLSRVVVKLTAQEISDGPDWFPEAVITDRANGTPATGSHHRIAGLVWDAAVERFGQPDHPVLLTHPGTQVWAAELLDCQCDSWASVTCDACGGSGYVYQRKAS